MIGFSLIYVCEGILGILIWFKENNVFFIKFLLFSLFGVSIILLFLKYGRMRKEVIILNVDFLYIGMYECRLNYKGKIM